MPDVRIEYKDSTAYAEVVLDYDPAYAEMYAQTMKPRGEIPRLVPLPASSRVWFGSLGAHCHVKKFVAAAPKVIADVEATGHTFEDGHDWDRAAESAVPPVVELQRLGVVHLLSRPTATGESGELRLTPDGVEGPYHGDWQVFAAWLDALLHAERLADVRRKLLATGAAERHCFVGLTFATFGDAYFAMNRQNGLPPVSPDMPEEITHLWLMHFQGDHRCLVWSPAHGWRDAERSWAVDP
jgi:hypothetical protein